VKPIEGYKEYHIDNEMNGLNIGTDFGVEKSKECN
tara:strand:- start:2542 stop:2646 length:105 start_codon:yes stop_codon:yes gene_type:complete